MQADLGKSSTNGGQSGNMIFVGMGQKEVPQLERIFGKEIKNRLGIPPGIEESSFPRNFVPYQITIYRNVVGRRGDATQLTPGGQIFLSGFPTFSNRLQLAWFEAESDG